MDHIFSQQDSLASVYTIDDGGDVTTTIADPYSADIEQLREQVLSIEETHIFSPSTLNVARFGFSRAGYFFTGEPTPGTPAADVPGFLLGHPVGAVVVGGSAASNPQASIGLAGSNNGSDLSIHRNLFTHEDRVTLTRGRHQISVGAWFQQFQSNEALALSQFGQATFTSLATFLTGTTSTFLVRSRSHCDELAIAVWRVLCGRRYTGDCRSLQFHWVSAMNSPPAGMKRTDARPTTPSPMELFPPRRVSEILSSPPTTQLSFRSRASALHGALLVRRP